MRDPYPATFQRRHLNVTSPVPPFYTRNNNLSDGLYGTTQDTTLDQLMKHMSDWNHPFVFDIGYTLPIAPDTNNAVGIGERGMLHAFSYSGKHFYCIDASKGWQESPYALKSDLQSNLLYKEFTTESQSWKALDSYRQNYTDPVGYKFLTICYTRTNGWIGATYAIRGNGFFDIYVPAGSGNGSVTLGALFVKNV